MKRTNRRPTRRDFLGGTAGVTMGVMGVGDPSSKTDEYPPC